MFFILKAISDTPVISSFVYSSDVVVLLCSWLLQDGLYLAVKGCVYVGIALARWLFLVVEVYTV